MGQSSSAGSKTALPSNNLLIDASDSYVTDVKLRSTSIIPISEYIKKDKNSKRLQQLKRDDSEDKNEHKSKDKIKTRKDNKSSKKEQKNNEKQSNVEDLKIQKKRFIESSFEDIPNNRKWINIHSKSKPQSPNESKNIKNQKTQTNIVPNEEKVNKNIKTPSSEEIKQLYKNQVYPHIYKKRYVQKEEKRPKSVPPESDNNSKEEDSNRLNLHHCKHEKIRKHNALSVQTNIACVIHPDLRKQIHSAPSKESIKRRNPKSSSSYSDVSNREENFDKISRSHRKYLSGKQALENWKNIHTIKQHKKYSNTNHNTYPEENYRYRTHDDYNENYSPPRSRSRGGQREKIHEFTPLEISNYNYSRAPQNPKSYYISPKEIKQTQNRRKHPQIFERESSRFEYIENPARKYDGEKNYYRNLPERDMRIVEREDFIADMERCLQQKIASVYGRVEGRTQTPNKTTWVQDKYRRWHKVVLE